MSIYDILWRIYVVVCLGMGSVIIVAMLVLSLWGVVDPELAGKISWTVVGMASAGLLLYGTALSLGR